jgi:hypothetical protein
MLSFVDFEAVLEEEFGFFGDGAHFRMFGEVGRGQDGAGQALEAAFQFGDALDDLRGGDLSFNVGVKGDFAFDLLDVLGDGGFAVVYGVDDLGDEACQWIGIWHERDYRSEIGQVERRDWKAGCELGGWKLGRLEPPGQSFCAFCSAQSIAKLGVARNSK